MRTVRPYTYLGTVRGMCRGCRELVPARVIAVDGAVYQERLCPRCGTARARIADDVAWYLGRVKTVTACKGAKVAGGAVREGCPRDCGPCAAHANACHLPVFSITNACDMRCPICFTYNQAKQRYFMGREELRGLLDKMLARVGPVDLVDITGGEPTLHPELLGLLDECRREEIGRIMLNSNGNRLAQDEGLCAELAKRGVYVVLSFDTFRAERAVAIHGRDVVGMKLRALENLRRAGVGVTLMNVMIRGVNEDEIGVIIELASKNENVRNVTVQTMTFTGQGGKDFPRKGHMPLDGAAAAVEAGTGGVMRREHFFAHPGAHPLCYSLAYYLRSGGALRSFTELFGVEELGGMFGDGYLMDAGQDERGAIKEAIDRAWARGADETLLRQIRGLIERLYPAGRTLTRFERQRVGEQDVLAVTLHSHMDEDTLDLGRLAVCPDQVPDAEGRMIPACAYNLF